MAAEPREKRKNTRRTFLEIGVGEKGLNVNLPHMQSGDRYVGVDFGRFPHKPKQLLDVLAEDGIHATYARADAFKLPLAKGSVDRTVLFNVVSEKAFPNSSGLQWNRRKKLTVQEAMEKLEEELHRVTKPGGSVEFKEHYTPSVMRLKIPFITKSRLDRLKQAFGKRWHIEIEKPWHPWLKPVVVNLRKK